MRKVFPEMTESLNKGLIFCVFAYWVFCFVIFPFLMPIVAYGAWTKLSVVSWIELIYHAVNSMVLIGILKQHLADSFFSVQIDFRSIARTVMICCGLMFLWALLVGLLIYGLAVAVAIASGSVAYHSFLLDIFPISEMGIAVTPGLLVQTRPVLGTICLTVLVPFAITGLFYATSFAPVCCNHPRLAYLVVAAVLLIPAVFDIFWRENAIFVLLTYFLSLPIHWFACWSYQKTDNVWAPVFSLGIFNLVFSLANIFT